ncbi:MAG: DUF3325 domain-containing protein [Pseudomonadota bacterium]
MTSRLTSIWRITLALLGGFAIAVTVTAALAFVLVAEGVTNRGDAFYWSAYVGFVIYFLAMVWAFASNNLINVTRVYALVIFASGIAVWAQGGDASFGYGPAMSRFILLLALLATLWIGFAALALNHQKHWTVVMHGSSCPPQTVRTLRAIAWVMLTLSFILTLMRDGIAFGLILWPMVAFVVGLMVSLSIAYKPQFLRRFAGDVTYFTMNGPASDEGTDAA